MELSLEQKTTINNVLLYAETMIGVPYRWWIGGDTLDKDDKFWSENGLPVSRKEIDSKNKSIVCTGLINLMRRFVGLSVPGASGELDFVIGNLFPGGTYTWFTYLETTNRLQKLDITKKYPKGTLVARNYESPDKCQGHVAVIIDEKGSTILEQNIIHAFPLVPYKECDRYKDAGSVDITNFEYYNYGPEYPTGFFTYVCLPENWLLKE
jgi:hypothetical protein